MSFRLFTSFLVLMLGVRRAGVTVAFDVLPEISAKSRVGPLDGDGPCAGGSAMSRS